MAERKQESTMNTAASQLRAMIRVKEDGTHIGGETDLQKALGVSRTTLRQVARLLEREGLLTVKRGLNGGYFATRPDAQTVESAVTAYLEMLDVRLDELMALAAMTWEETLKQAAKRSNDSTVTLVNTLNKMAGNVSSNTTYRDLILIEKQMRQLVFDSTDSPYMRFIFQVNLRFVEKSFEPSGGDVDIIITKPELLSQWKNMKALEIESIRQSDVELATLAALRSRRYWDSITYGISEGPEQIK